MKIGFYGSSFCSEITNKHCERYNYSSFLEIVRLHYNAEICHLGNGGAGYWDILLNQSKEILANPPDVAVFIWPIPELLHHPEYSPIYPDSIQEGSRLYEKRPDLHPAVSLYYQHFYNPEKEKLEWRAAMMYADSTLIKQIPSTTKIIHIWEWGEAELFNIDLSDPNKVSNMKYPYDWTTGSTIISPIFLISAAGQYPARPTFRKIMRNDPRCNHLEGAEKNELIANWIISVIDSESDVFIDKTQDTIDLFKRLSNI